MPDTDTKNLLLQIDASVELLKSNLQQGDAAVAKFHKNTTEKLNLIDSAFEKVGDHVKEIAVGFGAFFAAEHLIELAKQGLEFAASLGEVAQQVGVTAKDLQVFRYAASQVGISNEEMDKGLQKFTKSLGQARTGSEAAIKVFKALGFTDDDIKHLDVHEALLKTAQGIGEIGDRATRATPETQLFGRAGQQLDTLFSQGASGIEKFAAQAEKLGLIIPDEFLERAARAEHKVSELKQVLSVRIADIVAENADAITTLANALEAAALAAGHYIQQTRGAFTIIKNEGLTADLAATPQETLEAGTTEGYRDRARRQYREARAAYHANPTSPDQLQNYREAVERFGKAQLAVNDERAQEAAAAKLAGGGRTLDGLNAPKGKSAAQLAEEAARRAKRAQDEEARLDDAYLAGKGQLTADVVEQAAIARRRLDSETAAKLADVDAQVKTKQINAADADALKAKIRRNADLEQDAINRRENEQLEREQFEIANASLDYLRQITQSQDQLATTNKERLALALKILAAERDAERAQLQAIKDDESRTPGHQRYTDAQHKEADIGLQTLSQRYGLKQDAARQQYASPLEAYGRQLHQDTDDMNSALQGVAAHGLGSLTDGLAAVVSGTKTLKAAFADMAATIVADRGKTAIGAGS